MAATNVLSLHNWLYFIQNSGSKHQFLPTADKGRQNKMFGITYCRL